MSPATNLLDLLAKSLPPQEAFIESTAIEAGFCGGKGAGKTWALLWGAAKHIEHSRYCALLLRRHYDAAQAFAVEMSHTLYALVGGTYDQTRLRWTFPSGASIEFGISEDLEDAFRYGGSHFQYIGIDGLDTFEKPQYDFLVSRLRNCTTARLPLRMRSTFPDDPDCEWVYSHFAPWLVPDEKVWDEFRAGSGEIVHYVREKTGTRRVPNGTSGAISRTLIKSESYMNQLLVDLGYDRSGIS